MKLLVLLLTTLLPALAQAPLPFDSHQVNPDHTITFRYQDPGATRIDLHLEGSKTLPMVKGSNGLWTVTTPALPPEIYLYRIDVDGRPQFDPNNLTLASNLYFRSNPVTVPGATSESWEPSAIPHGAVHHHTFTTKVVTGLPANQSEYYVYTPPGYDPRAATTYPVLYLLHGWSQSAIAWTEIGHANLILDSLIARGKARPMIVVMPLGYGAMSFATNYSVWDDGAAVQQNVTLFAQSLATEVLPQVEAQYRVSRDRTDRAIAGLSMGGLESLAVGLNDTRQFAWIAGFSAAVPSQPEAEAHMLPALDPKTANLRLLWIACGTDDNLIKANRSFAAHLKSLGLAATIVETPGQHTWMVWRDDLVRLAPLLFQPDSPPR